MVKILFEKSEPMQDNQWENKISGIEDTSGLSERKPETCKDGNKKCVTVIRVWHQVLMSGVPTVPVPIVLQTHSWSSHMQRTTHFDQSELIYLNQNLQPNMSKVVITARGSRKALCFVRGKRWRKIGICYLGIITLAAGLSLITFP